MNYYGDLNPILAVFGGLGIVLFLLIVTFIVISIVASWKLFKKAGKNGWESIIPFYSTWVLNDIAGLNWWWFILLILDVTFSYEIEGLTFAFNVCYYIATFNCYYNIARRFGKDKSTCVLAGIFPVIFMMIFAFSIKERYDGNIKVSANGIFGGENKNVHDSMNNNDTGNNNNFNSYNANVYDNNVNKNIQSTETVDMSNNHSNNNVVSRNAFCGNCGFKLSTDSRFCPNCGKEIK